MFIFITGVKRLPSNRTQKQGNYHHLGQETDWNSCRRDAFIGVPTIPTQPQYQQTCGRSLIGGGDSMLRYEYQLFNPLAARRIKDT
jgi:hypothetical protein